MTRERAEELDRELTPLYRAMTVAPAAISAKTALELLGVIGARVRLPMVPASASERETIRETLERQGLLAASGAR